MLTKIRRLLGRSIERAAANGHSSFQSNIGRWCRGRTCGAACVVMLAACFVMPTAASAHHSKVNFTVKLTKISISKSSVAELGDLVMTLSGTYSPSREVLVKVQEEDVERAALRALKFGGTASASDIKIVVHGSRMFNSSNSTFSREFRIDVIEDGLQEGTETLTLSHGNLPPVSLQIIDSQAVNIAVDRVFFSKPNIAEGENGRLTVEVTHNLGALTADGNYIFNEHGVSRLSLLLSYFGRLSDKVTASVSGSASNDDLRITVPPVPRRHTLGGSDSRTFSSNYAHPVGYAAIHFDVSAVADEEVEGPETVIAGVSGKSATMVIFDKDAAIVPHLQVRPASPAVTGPIGARKANFIVTNYGANTDKAFNFYASRTGAVAPPAGAVRVGAPTTGLVSEHQFPAGATGQSMSLAIAVDEASLKDADGSVTVRIDDPSSGQSSYTAGTPRVATVHLSSHASIVQRTQQVIARHMNRVAALITGDTGSARLRDRQQARSSSDSGSGTQPYHLGGSLTDQQDQFAGNVDFATSADRLRGAARAEKRRRVTASGIDATKYSLGRNNAADPSPAWDVWVTGKYSYERTGKGADRSSGHTGLVRAGTDYLLDPETLVGVMAQYDTSKDKSTQQGFEVSGHGWMVGPYLEKQLSSNIYFDAKVLGGKSSNEVSPFATYTDSFDTTRWLAAARLTGYWTLGQWQFTPSAEIVTYQDRQASYTDSNGLEIGGQTLRVNRFNFGPEISRRFVTSDGMTIEPRLALRGLWRFGGKRSDVDTSGPNSIAVDPIDLDGLQGRVELGLNVRTQRGVSVGLDGSYDGIGSSERTGASVSGRVRVPLQ